MSELNELIKLSKKHIKPASLMLSRAFQNDAVIRWQIPELKRRLIRVQNYWQLSLRIGIKYGVVYGTSEDLEGIIILRPPTKEVSYWKYLTNGVIKFPIIFGIKSTKRITFVQAVRDSLRNIYMKLPHWYLELLAVDPKHQGKGFARMLLEPFLKYIDQAKLPIWLDTTNKGNLAFFEKFNFTVLEEIIIPNTNIITWFMVRYGEL